MSREQCRVINLALRAVEVAVGLPVQLHEINVSDLGSGVDGTLLVGEIGRGEKRKLAWFIHNNGRLDFELDGVNYGGACYRDGEIDINKKGDATTWVGTSWQNRKPSF